MQKEGIIKISLLIIFSIVLATSITVAFIFLPKDEYLPYSIETIQFPDYVKEITNSHYTASGKIVFQYKNVKDNKYYVAVINDDGTNIRNIYNGEIKPFYDNTNGVRLMPFQDNKRILLGDGILECEPSIDEVTDPSKQTKIIPIEYPEELVKMDGVFFLWSEIIISPDNIHMGWSTLSKIGAIVCISRLEKQGITPRNTLSLFINKSKNNNVANDVKYVMRDVQVINDFSYYGKDPDHSGFLKVNKYIHGGEIKQFSWDCQQISFVGSTLQGLARSVIQNLNDDEVHEITHEPGYDETTIVSPDGQYGIVMTTRFSPKTSSRILGLIPRPYSALGLMNMSPNAYMYGITGVRLTRKGNIGPALILISESMKDNDYDRKYHGYDLHDVTNEHAFVSPMSWHPSSSRAIWTENVKNNLSDTRIRKVVLSSLEFKPKKQIKCEKNTPDDINYALKLSDLKNLTIEMPSGKIESPLGIDKGGYIEFNSCDTNTSLRYINYTEDEITFYNGYEEFYIDGQVSNYLGKLTMFKYENEHKNIIGEMDFNLSFSGYASSLKLVRDKSYGFSKYNGIVATIDEMED